jgi:hypothetical protein
MKKIVIRSAGSGRGPAVQRSRPKPGRHPSRPAAEDERSKAPVVVTVVVGLIVIVLVLASSANRPDTAARKAVPAPVPAKEEPQPPRWDELGGKTMAEWMKENNKDNAELRERQERMRRYRSGKGE